MQFTNSKSVAIGCKWAGKGWAERTGANIQNTSQLESPICFFMFTDKSTLEVQSPADVLRKLILLKTGLDFLDLKLDLSDQSEERDCTDWLHVRILIKSKLRLKYFREQPWSYTGSIG